MKYILTVFAGIAGVVNALATPDLGGRGAPPSYSGAPGGSAWDLKKFSSLVIFGDSYSDDSRLGYFISNGTPPVGWINPPVRRPFSVNTRDYILTSHPEQQIRRWRLHLGRVRRPLRPRQPLQLRRQRRGVQQQHHAEVFQRD